MILKIKLQNHEVNLIQLLQAEKVDRDIYSEAQEYHGIYEDEDILVLSYESESESDENEAAREW